MHPQPLQLLLLYRNPHGVEPEPAPEPTPDLRQFRRPAMRPPSSWRRIGVGLGLAGLYVGVAVWWERPVAWHAGSEMPGFVPAGGLTVLTFAELYLTLWVLVSGARGLVGDPTHLSPHGR